MITFVHKGDFSKTNKFLDNLKRFRYINLLNKYGEEGVRALSANTPIDSGITASSWYYEIIEDKGSVTIRWCNSNLSDGIPIAILIQYGHATKNGGFVEGRDFVNPAMQSIFDDIATNVWREVTRL